MSLSSGHVDKKGQPITKRRCKKDEKGNFRKKAGNDTAFQ